MIKKVLSKAIYHVYDLTTFGKLSKWYKKVKDAHEEKELFNDDELNNYLQKWGFEKEITANPIMGKSDVFRSIKNVDDSKVKSWAYTGGSYGEPLRVPYSKERNLIRTATFKYYNELGGYHLGDEFALIRAKNKSKFLKFLRNETIIIPFDTSEAQLGKILDDIKRKRITVLLGYPTVMYDLALYLNKYPKSKSDLPVKALISASEPLEDFKRKVIYDAFGCSFVDRYSNEEVGLIAQQREFNGPHYVNKFGVYVEVVNPNTNKPVKEGEQGKVVVTDIYNDLIPVVRYDTGDFATVEKYKNGQLHTMTNIVGRVTEQIISVSGNPISPLMLGPYIYKPLSKQGRVFQYQFAQVDKDGYELRLKATRDDLPSKTLSEIKNGLINVLGDRANFEFKFVNDIKPQPSGKRPVFKNETN